MSKRMRGNTIDKTGAMASSPQQLVWTRKLINQFWDGVSQTRLTELSFSRICGKTLIGYLSGYLNPGTRCLDYGSGDGSLVKLLVERGCPTAAYEPSNERRSQIAGESLEENPLYLGTVDTEDEGSFDVIIAAEVVEHILGDEIEEALNTFRRYLEPGGLLIVTTPNNEDLELGACYCPVSNKAFHRWQHLRSLTADSLDAMLSQGGFTRIADHRVDFSAYGQLYEQFLQLEHDAHYMSRLGPFYPLVKRFLRRRMPDELRLGSQTHLIYVGRAV